MKSFKSYISEVAEPTSPDEKRFKDKHVIAVTDYPGSEDDKEVQNMTKKSPAKKKRLADNDQESAEKVYEGKDGEKCEECGGEDGEHEEDCPMMKEEMSPDQIKKREEIVKSMKKDTESLKKRYGDKWKEVMYATATKKAMGEAVEVNEGQKPYVSGNNGSWEVLDGAGKVAATFTRKNGGIQAANAYLDKNFSKLSKVKESIDEAYKVGDLKLKDGSSVKLTSEDVKALNNLYKNLNAKNKTTMENRAMQNAKAFKEVLSFAREAL